MKNYKKYTFTLLASFSLFLSLPLQSSWKERLGSCFVRVGRKGLKAYKTCKPYYNKIAQPVQNVLKYYDLAYFIIDGVKYLLLSETVTTLPSHFIETLQKSGIGVNSIEFCTATTGNIIETGLYFKTIQINVELFKQLTKEEQAFLLAREIAKFHCNPHPIFQAIGGHAINKAVPWACDQTCKGIDYMTTILRPYTRGRRFDLLLNGVTTHTKNILKNDIFRFSTSVYLELLLAQSLGLPPSAQTAFITKRLASKGISLAFGQGKQLIKNLINKYQSNVDKEQHPDIYDGLTILKKINKVGCALGGSFTKRYAKYKQKQYVASRYDTFAARMVGKSAALSALAKLPNIIKSAPESFISKLYGARTYFGNLMKFKYFSRVPERITRLVRTV